jgi:hypothetical protein
MLGRTFKQLKECIIQDPHATSEDLSKCKELQVEMPACTRFEWAWADVNPFPFISSPNLQILVWNPSPGLALDEAVLKSLHNFLLNCSCLQELDIMHHHQPGHQQHYEKWWKKFTVSKDDGRVSLTAFM